jgi:anti-sigma B factor antagonist
MNASSLNMQQHGEVRIITLSGGKVRVVEDLMEAELEGLTKESRGGHLLLDFSKVEYITSDDLGVLINLHKRMQRLGGRLTLCNLNAQVYEVFTVTRLHTLLTILQG